MTYYDIKQAEENGINVFAEHCPKCGEEISTKDEHVSAGYYGACLNCDEDFYKFELNNNK